MDRYLKYGAVKRLLLWMTLLLASFVGSACTLGTAQEAREDSLNATQTALPLSQATLAVVVTEAAGGGGSGVQLTPLTTRQPTPVLQPNGSSSCEGTPARGRGHRPRQHAAAA